MAELAISSQYRHLYINNIYLYLNFVTHVCMSVLRNHNNNNNIRSLAITAGLCTEKSPHPQLFIFNEDRPLFKYNRLQCLSFW